MSDVPDLSDAGDDEPRGRAFAYMHPMTRVLTILCPRGHVQSVEPSGFTAEYVTYGSSADFCAACEEDEGYEGTSFLEYDVELGEMVR